MFYADFNQSLGGNTLATFTIKNLSFTYPQRKHPALSHISLTVEYGELIVVCGQTGCGKSTLLRNLKTALTPHGKKEGTISFYNRPLESIEFREQASRIGFVMQNPDNQIVTDKVWHELAFGLESLGYDSATIRLRVAEMAGFFGIQSWFHRDVSQLSGGQKQLLNLASVMAMQPDVLILDEPTSQLDPIAAGDFLDTIRKINREIGTTVILTEHRLEEVLPMADRVVVLDKGKILVDAAPREAGSVLVNEKHPMLSAMPTPMQIFAEIDFKRKNVSYPITVREGRNRLTEIFEGRELKKATVKDIKEDNNYGKPIFQLKDVWFRYSKEEPDVIKGLSMEVAEGQLYCIVGGNGTGKTTALNILGGIRKPYRGQVLLKGKWIGKYKESQLYNGLIGILPQDPKSLFVEKSVELDLLEVLDEKKLAKEEKEARVASVAELVEINELLEAHPYDLSGGEQQRVALAKILLLEPEIILMDEPTKGLDNYFKEKLARILKKLLKGSSTIVLVSHDIEFCGRYGDRCAMFFDGSIVTDNTPNRFFSGNSFYTTAANRMSRHIFENAVTPEDVIA
ncbi:MAG: energy-coupling factor transporter ATPase [Bacteroidales bacterium]|nr:energy-coupling factor transporter ATPase [Bacteroidales bacterium]